MATSLIASPLSAVLAGASPARGTSSRRAAVPSLALSVKCASSSFRNAPRGIRRRAAVTVAAAPEGPEGASSPAEPSTPATPTPPPSGMDRGQITAIITGAISLVVAVGYLVLVFLLDSRSGGMLPPPPEAFGP